VKRAAFSPRLSHAGPQSAARSDRRKHRSAASPRRGRIFDLDLSADASAEHERRLLRRRSMIDTMSISDARISTTAAAACGRRAWSSKRHKPKSSVTREGAEPFSTFSA
jgi:hypothetical protein